MDRQKFELLCRSLLQAGVTITKGDNARSKKGRVVIPVCNTSSHPVLHFYQVPSKYSEGYSSFRADTKSSSNKTKGNNSKSKIRKPELSFLYATRCLVHVLHFYQVSSKYSKGYSSYRVDKFYTDANRIHPKKNMSPHPSVRGDINIHLSSNYLPKKGTL